jgi:hypothetical protein
MKLTEWPPAQRVHYRRQRANAKRKCGNCKRCRNYYLGRGFSIYCKRFRDFVHSNHVCDKHENP